MWAKIVKWFHHIIDPHCVICKNDKIDLKDDLIEEYKEMLSSARLEIGRLTQALVDLSRPADIIEQKVESPNIQIRRKLTMNEAAIKLNKQSQEHAAELRRQKDLESNKSNKSNDLKEEVERLEREIGIN